MTKYLCRYQIPTRRYMRQEVVREEIHILLFYFIPFNSTLVAINICPEISRHINQFHIIIGVSLYTRCFSNISHVDESWKGFCSWHGLGWVIYQQTSNNSLEGSFFVACEYSSLRSFTWQQWHEACLYKLSCFVVVSFADQEKAAKIKMCKLLIQVFAWMSFLGYMYIVDNQPQPASWLW